MHPALSIAPETDVDRLALQPLQLGLFRSDYMVHLPDANAPASLKQVEFNTISSSFGTLSERVAALHRYVVMDELCDWILIVA